MPPASSALAGVTFVEEGSADMILGVDLPAIVDVVSKPTGLDMVGPQADPLKLMLCLMMLSLTRHWMMVSKHMNRMNLLTNPKLHFPTQGWQLAMLVIGSSHRCTF